MFGINDFVSTIIISILSLLLVVTIILPNIFRLKEKIWQSIKLALFLVLITLVIVFSNASLEVYYYLGSFLGAGLLVKGIISTNRVSLIWFLLSFISFSLVFLSIGQTIFFVICVGYTYVLMIGFTAFYLYKNKIEGLDFQISRKTQISSFILLLALPAISIYILLFMSQNEMIKFEPISLYSLFSGNYEAIAILIIFLVLLVILILIFLVEFRNRNQHRRDDLWFS